MVFDKDAFNAPPFNGRANSNVAGILAVYFRTPGGVCRHDARAGSGRSDRLETQEKGPLPNDSYKLGATDHKGSEISGWRTVLTMDGYGPGQARSPGRATLRTALYLHSEMPRDLDASKAYVNPPPAIVLPTGRTLAFSPVTTTAKDSPALWDGDGDYVSLGCIKIAPANVAILLDLLGSLKTNGIPLQVIS